MVCDIKVEFLKSSMGDCALVSLPTTCRALSSAPLGFGFLGLDKILILQVPKDYDSERPEEELRDLIDQLKLGDNTAALMTAAKIRKVLTVKHKTLEDLHVTVILTAGTANALVAGELPLKEDEEVRSGTINIIAFVNRALTDGALVNSVITITEAKGRVGSLLSKAVREALVESLSKAGEVKSRSFLERLSERGIAMGELLETALALHIPHNEREVEKVKQRFVEELTRLADDVNINSLVCSALYLEDLGSSGRIHGLSVNDFNRDAVHILADELIGMAIAEYISGPGILASLGPFLDDVVASLVGGVMSSIYSKP